jgi:hypothetical protein
VYNIDARYSAKVDFREKKSHNQKIYQRQVRPGCHVGAATVCRLRLEVLEWHFGTHCSHGPRRLHPPDGVGRNNGRGDTWRCGGISGDTGRGFGARLPVGRFCAEDMSMMMFARAFSHNGEIDRASRCRGIDVLYGGYSVVYEVEAAPQTPLWAQKAKKCSGRCSGAGVGM